MLLASAKLSDLLSGGKSESGEKLPPDGEPPTTFEILNLTPIRRHSQPLVDCVAFIRSSAIVPIHLLSAMLALFMGSP
ncbi:hypothetical protein N7517_006581 [Penicillium concentricum]|uniref:Uncharacterized protein n=1 Tax=Penicillium concentricum TaxID=293559 RepID=A0A9W9VCK6_9EURO|nr:uncharacterized protein N7517_006581 [Penicillium concentricum]KAJ5374575.1 hypothetical protein N7517_006581 [Penicillium concentricum]